MEMELNGDSTASNEDKSILKKMLSEAQLDNKSETTKKNVSIAPCRSCSWLKDMMRLECL